jgi:hypothetical protein
MPGPRRILPVLLAALAAAPPAFAAPAAAEPINPAPTAADWAALGKLPDWSGVWGPDIPDQDKQLHSNTPPWTPKAAALVARMQAEEKAGHPRGLFVPCFPEAMPAWMLISHNPMEILFTPGRVTMLGESDSTRLRRIYTDGRPHPADPDLTFHGHSIGHWEGDTLVVDTVGVLPQTYVAVSEAVGVPNDGDMHIIERIHLAGPDTLHDDLTITAPKILTAPWKTTRSWYRERERKYDIVEGVCELGQVTDGVDEDGNSIFAPVPHKDGNAVLPDR